MTNKPINWDSDKNVLHELAEQWRMFSKMSSSSMQVPQLTPIQQQIFDQYTTRLRNMVANGFNEHLFYEDELPHILMPVEYLDLFIPKIKRYVQIDEISDPTDRWLASLTSHPIIEDTNGTYRFEQRDFNHFHDINTMSVKYQRGHLDRDEFMQFYRDIGYSLGGFWEIWGTELDIIQREQTLSEPIEKIEEEIYDNGDVSEQFLDMAQRLTTYNSEYDTMPDLNEVVKLLRFAELIYRQYTDEKKYG